MIYQFCPYCGAGIGPFRRIGEGTCEKCDNQVVENLLEELTDKEGEIAELKIEVEETRAGW